MLNSRMQWNEHGTKGADNLYIEIKCECEYSFSIHKYNLYENRHGFLDYRIDPGMECSRSIHKK